MFQKGEKLTVLFHVLVWLILFSFPYLLSYGHEQVLNNIIRFSWIPLFLYAIIFYLNYFVFVDKFFFSKKTAVFIISNLVLILICIAIRELSNQMFFQNGLPEKKGPDGPPVSLFVYIQIISFFIPVIFSIALKIAERYIKTEAERKEAVNFKLESELQHLKYQLQPHFFFNSLNNIYTLVDLSPEQAKSSIHSLSKLMRYLLYETNTPKVSLQQEVQFLEKYINLMKLRVADNIKVICSFSEITSNIQVAPLLFISLVENAFKHGVAANKSSHLIFEMEVNNNEITFKTQNPNLPKTKADKSGSGIGLKNLEKRLNLLYPNTHKFSYGVNGHVFETLLILKAG